MIFLRNFEFNIAETKSDLFASFGGNIFFAKLCDFFSLCSDFEIVSDEAPVLFSFFGALRLIPNEKKSREHEGGNLGLVVADVIC